MPQSLFDRFRQQLELVGAGALEQVEHADLRRGHDRAGAIVTSTEVCVFDLLERAGSDEFKLLSKAIK